jgi:hypothetical protein
MDELKDFFNTLSGFADLDVASMLTCSSRQYLPEPALMLLNVEATAQLDDALKVGGPVGYCCINC